MKQMTFDDISSRVLIIGGDHHNTLGVIRAVGRTKVKFTVLIHSNYANKRDICCQYSKYIRRNLDLVQPTENAIISYLTSHFADEKDILVLPTSDFAEFVLDKNYDLLSKKYILPSINNTQGEICKYMDKFEQEKLARKYNIPMAKTWLVDLQQAPPTEDLVYPCICKPSVSAAGNKSDIRVAHDKSEISGIFSEFINKGYLTILIQEFLEIDYEVVVSGCCTRNAHEFAYLALRKIRRYPLEGGSLTYAQQVTDSEQLRKISKIIYVLQYIGYDGLFDVELFNVDGVYYLNEINFRNSGNACIFTQNNVNLPELWGIDRLGHSISGLNMTPSRVVYLMDFMSELWLVLHRNASITTSLRSFYKTTVFTKWDKHDLLGSVIWFFHYVKIGVKNICSGRVSA